MQRKPFTTVLSLLKTAAALLGAVAPVQAADKMPNLVFLFMGDENDR
jgi:hypothetical protein